MYTIATDGTEEITESHDSVKARPSVEFLHELVRELAAAVELLEPTASRDVTNGIDFYDEVKRFEVNLIQRALFAAGGQQKRAAYFLGMKTTTLNAKIRAYGLDNGRRPGRVREAKRARKFSDSIQHVERKTVSL